MTLQDFLAEARLRARRSHVGCAADCPVALTCERLEEDCLCELILMALAEAKVEVQG